MEAIILNTVYNYNYLNPNIELYINKAPFLLKVNQIYFNKIISLKSIYLEKLIGSKIKFEFLKKGDKLNNTSSKNCKYDNSYFKYLEFDINYISKNTNELNFAKVISKEFYFDKVSADPHFWNYYRHMYVPKLNFYSDSTIVGKIDILDISNFYTCLFKETNIFRKEANCLQNKSDEIDITIEIRIEINEIKFSNNIDSKENKKIKALYKRLYEKSHRTFQTIDYDLYEELKFFIESY